MQSILLTCSGTGLCWQSKPHWQQSSCLQSHKSSSASAWVLVQKAGNKKKKQKDILSGLKKKLQNYNDKKNKLSQNKDIEN